MTVLEGIKKALKMNETLESFGLKTKFIGLSIMERDLYEIHSLKELKQILKEEYVEEYYKALLNVELDSTFKASGTFSFETYNGKQNWWCPDYELQLIVE